MEKYARLDNETDEELIFRIASEKELIGTWQDVADILNKLTNQNYSESKYRKTYQSFVKMLNANMDKITNDEKYLNDIKIHEEELRKEKVKIQTLNLERNKFNRELYRQELYYEYVGKAIQTLSTPDFLPLPKVHCGDKSYLCCLSDLHCGANFTSEKNFYSVDVLQERLEVLTGELEDFCLRNNVGNIKIACLGDTVQGMIHINDIKLNTSSMVKSIVQVSRLISQFLNNVSRFVNVEYYHVPTANHTQLRVLGTKKSELPLEDLEFVIGNYIKDLCKSNDRININLAEEGKEYVLIPILSYEVVAMHGHQIKNLQNAISNISSLIQRNVDYLILGHIHSGKEITVGESICNDTEVIVCPSIVGSDPYSDSIFKGSKAAVKIYGFEELYGHTESYKIILN